MLHKVVNFEDEALCGNAFVLKLVNFKDEALCGDAFVLKVDKFVRECAAASARRPLRRTVEEEIGHVEKERAAAFV